MIYSLKKKWVYGEHHIICRIMHTAHLKRIFMQTKQSLRPCAHTRLEAPSDCASATGGDSRPGALLPPPAERAVRHCGTARFGAWNSPFCIAKRPPLTPYAIATGLDRASYIIILYTSRIANEISASREE